MLKPTILILSSAFKSDRIFLVNGPKSSSSSNSTPPKKQQKPTTTTVTTTSTSTQTTRNEAVSETITFSSSEYSTDFSSVSEEDGNSTEDIGSSTTVPEKVCILMGKQVVKKNYIKN